MNKLAAGSVLFGAFFLTIFFSFESVQTVFANAYFQQEGQNLKSEKPSDKAEMKESVAEILKQGFRLDETNSLDLQFKATAYCLKGKTASGKYVRKGIIAADPRILPLGSNVTILHGPYAGDYLVADTGGKIKGNRIDIWMASCAEAVRFGRRSLMLRVPDRRDS